MSDCCASGSCEVCRPSVYGYPIERRRVRKLQQQAFIAHARGLIDLEREALDELALMERRYGCADGHRGPQGPNEDVAQCPRCWSMSFSRRPAGETFGEHLPDCSLPVDHLSYCEPVGSGHAPTDRVRGYFPPTQEDQP